MELQRKFQESTVEYEEERKKKKKKTYNPFEIKKKPSKQQCIYTRIYQIFPSDGGLKLHGRKGKFH